MKNYDLSILIPARNEMFLAKTIEDILSNIEGNTEIIVVLDGAWADPQIPQHERLTVIFNPVALGQRAATNQACKLSKAKYIIKTDAHCAFDKGFDVKLMNEMQDDWTMTCTMRNLHAFDWVCPEGHRRYQGPTAPCKECGKEMVRDVVWIAKKSPQSNCFHFDSTLHFQYFNELAKRQKDKQIVESMSLQGSFFMLTRAKYWELNICDEEFGSWGQQGVEVACKTWLSGGKVMVSKSTWYAHMFRTQGGDFGFPYELSGKAVDHARKHSRELFLNGKWPLAIHPISWLIKKFSPVPGWGSTKGILYYTDNSSKVDPKIIQVCQNEIQKGSLGYKIISVSLKPIEFGENIVLPLERGYLTMAKQILAGLEKLNTEFVFFCEHDVLYHPSHFEFTPPTKDRYFYNENVWKLRAEDGHALFYITKQLSGLCADRELLIKHFKERVQRIEAEGFSRAMGFEPGTHNRKERIDDVKSEGWKSEFPNIDIRHSGNLTSSRWKKEEFRDQRNCKGWKESNEIVGWGETNAILKNIWQRQ